MNPKFFRHTAGAVAALAFSLGLALPAAAQQKTVTVLTWAGAFLETLEGVKADVEKQCGCKIQYVTQGSGVAGMQTLEAQKANPQVDLWMAPEAAGATALQNGLIEAVTAEQVPNIKQLPPGLVFKSGPTIWSSPRGIFYRVDKTPFAIKTWEDLWDPRLKGLVTVSIQQDKGAFLVIASLLAGGNEKNMDPGFKKLQALKPNIGAVYKGDAESMKFVESGEVAVSGWGILGVVYKHLGPGSNYKFVMPPKPQFLSTNVITRVKGRPNQAEALKAMNAYLDAGILERIVENIGSLPSNKNSKPPSKLREVIPPIGDLYIPDSDYVNANYNAWVDRWNREIQTR